MGRLVHCQETCSHMSDYKMAVTTVFRNAMWRGYPQRLVQSVWSRFLFQRWHSTDIRVKPLRTWFLKVWQFLLKNDGNMKPDPNRTAPSLNDIERSKFLQLFGVHRSALPLVSSVAGASAHATQPPARSRLSHGPLTAWSRID